jgi:acetyl esterase
LKKRLLLSVFLLAQTLFAMCGDTESHRFTVMGFGDSITEGGKEFSSYLYPLWEKLFTAGYDFDFIGPRMSESRIGKIACCGYSGKNVEFLESIADSVYRKYPADYVLIHAGHNHYDSEKPVERMVWCYRSIIRKMTTINPNVRILLATVIESGKLPKYNYIPELNKAIKRLVQDLHSDHVVLVDQNKTHNWHTMTIADHVHPNRVGCERMAQVWFDALRPLLGSANWHFSVKRMGYKALENGDSLYAHVFLPKGYNVHSAIAWFFAGGWKYGSPLQFYRQSAHYASLGMTAVSFDYRIAWLHASSPEDALADCKDAIRWLRDHSSLFGIAPGRLAVGGASAGGAMALTAGCADKRLADYRSCPDLLLLEYPTLHMATPYLRPGMPPMLLMMGTADEFTPMGETEKFVRQMERMDNSCEFHPFAGRHHPIYQYRKPLTEDYRTMLLMEEKFLRKHHFLP